ncbi:expressed unknown protein [Seminavis robusta]|uniref:Uncharacterized protein n=1 Tax=Seminavis robusta TaxID=568900 RepID=A0A9N8EL91_9STRA|nr:expressed unknown protein [Seminavis robusta]|eukprot:Sro1270_g257990.1 n/a (561) ;mRNA; f:22790-24472
MKDSSLLLKLFVLVSVLLVGSSSFVLKSKPTKRKLLHGNTRFASIQATKDNASIQQNSSLKKRRGKQHPKALESCIHVSLEEQGRPVILLIDANNVRGKTDFEWTHRDMFHYLRAWKKQLQQHHQSLVHVIGVMDHACHAEAIHHHDMSVVFAGPQQTADDVIAQATRWFLMDNQLNESTTTDSVSKKGNNNNNATINNCNVFVVTSDGELKQRCLRCNRPGNWKRKQPQRDRVKVFGSLPFVRTVLESTTATADDDQPLAAGPLDKIEALEEDVRRFRYSRNRQAQVSDAQEEERGPWVTNILHSATATPSTWSLPTRTFEEKTWHRVLIAEQLRRALTAIQPPNTIVQTNCMASIVQDYLNWYNNESYNADDDDDDDDAKEGSSMFLDHRIRYEPHLQQELLYYLDQAVHSVTNTSVVLCNDNDNTQDTTPYSWMLSPIESSAAFLRRLVQESPHSTQAELLSRYKKEAPSHLQFTRQADLQALLLLVATRRNDDTKEWKLLQNEDQDWSGVPEPRRGRRAQRRVSRTRRKSRVVDDALVELGRVAEARWLDLYEREE